MPNQVKNKKTLIGVLASHDSRERNNSLSNLFNELVNNKSKTLENYHFLFTGGTFDRVITGTAPKEKQKGIKSVSKEAREFLIPLSTRLPGAEDGGVTILSYLIVRRQCGIIWPFLTPLTTHWLNPENLALMRLCDLWHVKRLMNSGSIKEWIEKEAENDKDRNTQFCPPSLIIGRKLRGQEPFVILPRKKGDVNFIERKNLREFPNTRKGMTVALIAHDDMKARMVEFAVEYEDELSNFDRILATGTTGREVVGNTRTLRDKVFRYHSGPKGGDIEIALEILFGLCHVVIFFVDTLKPHPHIEDIRVVFGACMIQDNVRMLTNEMQAREWMNRVVRGDS